MIPDPSRPREGLRRFSALSRIGLSRSPAGGTVLRVPSAQLHSSSSRCDLAGSADPPKGEGAAFGLYKAANQYGSLLVGAAQQSREPDLKIKLFYSTRFNTSRHIFSGSGFSVVSLTRISLASSRVRKWCKHSKLSCCFLFTHGCHGSLCTASVHSRFAFLTLFAFPSLLHRCIVPSLVVLSVSNSPCTVSGTGPVVFLCHFFYAFIFSPVIGSTLLCLGYAQLWPLLVLFLHFF